MNRHGTLCGFAQRIGRWRRLVRDTRAAAAIDSYNYGNDMQYSFSCSGGSGSGNGTSTNSVTLTN